MNIVITGADGFIGRNLRQRLVEVGFRRITPIVRDSSPEDLARAVANADVVFHLAGVNRPSDPSEFTTGNADFTRTLCEALLAGGRPVPVVLASSTQAILDNPYGRSKLEAEVYLRDYAKLSGSAHFIFRLTNVFGKWCRPNYNSVVATFCHNVSRGLPITVNDPDAPLQLVHVDDVVNAFVALLEAPPESGLCEAGPVHSTTVGELAEQIEAFARSRKTLLTERVGTGLGRALYATYISHLLPRDFTYDVPLHGDPRGVFVEMLKTPDCGQFSYFTAHPGITRGEHYHHSKTEKFLVIRGRAHFAFRHVQTDLWHEIVVEGGSGQIVETVPGWAHNITNIGGDELIVMLWANEIFDRSRPDTIAMKVGR